MDVLIVGTGVVGAGVLRCLADSPPSLIGRVGVVDRHVNRAVRLSQKHGPPVTVGRLEDAADVVVLATASGSQARLAHRFLGRSRMVLATSDSLSEVRRLLAMNRSAEQQGSLVVAGVGMAPGLSDVLAVRAAEEFDQVTELHVAKFGTAGPDCARQHHRALSSLALEWRGEWKQRPGGSGRELCWFPSPVDAADCYRAALPDPILLARRFPGLERITARMAATRRDRFSSWLPMLRSPHPEGKLGAVRVEARGKKGMGWNGRILGAAAAPGFAAAAVVVSTLELIGAGSVDRTGVAGLSEVVESGEFLEVLGEKGIVCQEFAGH